MPLSTLKLAWANLGRLTLLAALPLAAQAQTITFPYSGVAQTWTVPPGVTAIAVEATGGDGGSPYATTNRNYGGPGANVRATLFVTPNEVLTVYVGGSGHYNLTTTRKGGFNGGGTSLASGGGGATDVRTGAAALADRLLVAAGGGGATTSTTVYDQNFGAGGTPTGANGSGSSVYGGQGATQAAAGAGAYGTSSTAGSAGQLGSGGAGGSYSGAGGGAGYYGGGGGDGGVYGIGGGGGGSSWGSPARTASLVYATTSRPRETDGLLTFTIITAPTIISFAPASAAAGASVTITGTNLTDATSLTVNGVPAAITSATNSGLTFTVPVGAGPVQRVEVATPVGTASSTAFTALFKVVLPTSPAANATQAPRMASAVGLSFSEPVSSATAANLKVFSAQVGGLKAGSVTLNGSTANYASSLPGSQANFTPGEVVSVTLPTTMQNNGGLAATKRVYQFRTAVGATGTGRYTLEKPGTSVSGTPFDVAVGDFDNDGDLDFVSTNGSSNMVNTRFNDGTGKFSGGQTLSGTYANGVAVGDINGDGYLDIVLAEGQYAGSWVGVLLNNGNGTFRRGVDVPTGNSNTYGVALGDFDGDGDLDIAATVYYTNELVIRFNSGSGTFSGVQTLYAGPNPSHVLTGDMDNDGDLDVIVDNTGGNSGSSTAGRVLLNNGSGIFSAGATVGYHEARGIAVGDLDNDGDLDLITTDYDYYVKSMVWKNNGNGTFATSAASTVAVGTYSPDLELGDVDGDGDLDLLALGSGTVGVRFNDGTGQLSIKQDVAIDGGGPYAGLALGDVDADGDLDILTGNYSSSPALMQVLRNGLLTQPIIDSFAPASGPVGTSVVVSGSNLNGATAVAVNGVAVATYSTNAAGTQLTLVVPAGTTSGPISLTTSQGTGTSLTSFTVTVPALTSINPTSGFVGSTVTLYGTNLTGVTAITFGGTSNNVVTTGFTATSTYISGIVVPSGAVSGSVTATITANGLASTSNGIGFTVLVPPTITSFSPAYGPVGTVITVSGTNLGNATAAAVNGTTGTLTSYSSNSLTFTVRSGSTTGLVSVTTPGGTASSSSNFIVTSLPTISSFSPASGPEGTAVTVSGTNLNNTTGLTLNGQAVTGYTVNAGGTSLSFTVPVGAGTGRIVVSTLGGTATSSSSFTVTVPLALTGISPGSGLVGSTVALTGTKLTGTTAITFAGSGSNVVTNGFVVNAAGTQITGVVVPAGAVSGPVTVTTPGGSSNGVAFVVLVPPTISSFSPASGPVGTAVTVSGTNLNNTTGLTLNGQAVTGYTVNAGGTSLSFTVPAGAGTGRIVVSTSGGSVSSSTSFTVTVLPVLSSVSPGADVVGNPIVLTGTNLTGATAITFAGSSSNVVTSGFVVNAAGTQITGVVVPAGAVSGSVTVNTPSGVSNAVAFVVLQDLIISGGTLTNPVMISAGDYRNITVMGGAIATLSGAVTVAGTFTVSGTLNTNCQAMTGAGSFALLAGATLGICDAAGLVASGSTGAVQLGGPRSFSPDANYVYNGTVAQATGSGLPSPVRSLTTTNAQAVTLTSPVAISQTVTVAGPGNLVLNGQALTLLSSASGTALVVNAGTGIVSGATGTVQRYLDPSLNAGPGYRQYSSPVSGATVADFTTSGFVPEVNPGYNTSATPGTVTPFPTVFGYDQSRLATAVNNYSAFDKGFVSPASLGTPLAVGLGYTVHIAPDQLVDFVGQLNTGDKQVSLARNSGPTAAEAGWALVGNPYPAPLDLSLLAAADRPGVDASYYVSESRGAYSGTYRAYVNGVPAANSVVGTAQGFFVRVSDGQTSGSLTFRNSHRLTDYASQVPMRRPTADPRPLVQLTLGTTAGSLTDDFYLYAEAGATSGPDAGYDAWKLPNSTGLNLASQLTATEQLAIDGRPAFAAGTVVPLTVGVPAAGTYSLLAADLHNLPAGLTAYLADAATGQLVPLLVGTRYQFSVTAVQATALIRGRFTLYFQPQATLATASSLAAATIGVFPNPAHEVCTVLVPGVAGVSRVQVELLNAVGQRVYQGSAALPASGTSLTVPVAGLAKGIYTLRLQAGDAAVARRLTID